MRQSIEKPKKQAKALCKGAANPASWKIADDLAKQSVGCGCKGLGVTQPKGV